MKEHAIEDIEEFLDNWRIELERLRDEDSRRSEVLKEDLESLELRVKVLQRMVTVKKEGFSGVKDNRLVKDKIEEAKQKIQEIKEKIQNIRVRHSLYTALMSEGYRQWLRNP